MNTMKREDMIEEQKDLLNRIARMFVGMVGNAGRYAYLEGEILKVTPQYQDIGARKPKEVKDVAQEKN